ncbi:MAG: group III truncated hemoglobin [Flavobacteriaceae bacterium]|nr:group III truncated hemoglobin [Flavobacteriaceae bacterium]
MRSDIRNREDIALFVNHFYNKLLNDNKIRHFFDAILAAGKLGDHLETITDFWNGILFNSPDYRRDAMQPHLMLNKSIPFKKQHFNCWLQHFQTTIDEYFEGANAEKAKTRALSIATIMEIKMMNEHKE